MGEASAANGPFYRPTEVARLLHCSEWWVKDQAHHRRIPFSWIGGSYLFTEQHIAAIIRLFEVQPVEPGTSMSQAGRTRRSRSGTSTGAEASVHLVARVPPRVRAAQQDRVA
jgi:hypothetical protein